MIFSESDRFLVQNNLEYSPSFVMRVYNIYCVEVSAFLYFWQIFKNNRPKVLYIISVFKNLKNSQENTCARVSFVIKLQA